MNISLARKVKRLFLFVLACVPVVGALLMGAIIVGNNGPPRATPPPLLPYTCIHGLLAVPTQLGMLVVGDQAVCGYGLTWTDISGPPTPRPARPPGGGEL